MQAGATDTGNAVGDGARKEARDAARKRAAVELIARHGQLLKRTARRYSICAEDAEDAYQRGLEILLTKAPSERAQELLGWTRTVIKHEALAVRRSRERLLGAEHPRERADRSERIAQLPAASPGPEERLERREEIARSREALRALRPAELRALTLLAEGYSYAEIAEITGFSLTKVNRALAEGRARFRRLLSSSEDGSRCAAMAPLLSTFCDGETGPAETARVREHLRACASCRATVRAYRSTAARVAALAPVLPLARQLLERAREAVEAMLAWRPRPGAGGGAPGAPGAPGASGAPGAVGATAAKGTGALGLSKGTGALGLSKAIAVCAGGVGAAACVATGTLPTPAGLGGERVAAPGLERVAPRVLIASTGRERPRPRGAIGSARRDEKQEGGRGGEGVEGTPAREPPPAAAAMPQTAAAAVSAPEPEAPVAEPAAASEAAAPVSEPAPPGGGAAGEFGP